MAQMDASSGFQLKTSNDTCDLKPIQASRIEVYSLVFRRHTTATPALKQEVPGPASPSRKNPPLGVANARIKAL
ncbi:hypothetical protein E4U19_000901 [Claviceps sp. Clav32 group G5]|nr:hypothetical protein E4U19_000901 [Claviceps sp. Clav32 group G5]KAG6030033.1 hypothetical protein E4U40_000142 [Claviceps sp. LM458 group G5]KAG6050218.1 hypothetical protein E4U39_004624 [Claviceps sp. Clav50 group G5]